MIKSIHLKNYGPYRDETLELSPTFTAIIGASDEGKSMLVRSIEWVRTNRPLGDKFIRRGTSDSEVTITTDTDTVKRFKGKNGNGYQYNDEEPDTSIQSDVPDRVFDILKMSDLNVQKQFDNHFLVFDTSGKVGKKLNEIIHLEASTEVGDKIRSQIRSMNSELKAHEINKNDKEFELKKYEGFDKITSLVEKLEETDSKREEVANSLDQIEDYIEKLKKIEESKDCLDFDKALSILDELVGVLNDIKELESYISQIENYISAIEVLKVSYDGSKPKKFIDELIKVHTSINECMNNIDTIESYIEEIETSNKGLKSIIKEIKTLRKDYNKGIESIETCPTCGQDIDTEHRSIVLENL